MIDTAILMLVMMPPYALWFRCAVDRAGAVIRQLVWWPAGWALYIGFLWMYRDDRRRGWHDIAARSVVVRV